MDKLDRQVVRHKDKVQNHHHPAPKRLLPTPRYKLTRERPPGRFPAAQHRPSTLRQHPASA